MDRGRLGLSVMLRRGGGARRRLRRRGGGRGHRFLCGSGGGVGRLAGGLPVLHAQGVLHHFEFGRRVAGNLADPGVVPALVLVAALPRPPDALGHGHGHVRAEARGEAYGVLQVVVPALREIDAGEFRVGFLIVGYRRDDAGVQRAHGDDVLERGAHRVAGEALDVADHHLVGGVAESPAQRLHLGRGGAAAGRGIGLVRHEHRVRRDLFLLQAVEVLHLFHEVGHHGSHMLGVEARGVEGRVGGLGQEQAGERLHAAAAC